MEAKTDIEAAREIIDKLRDQLSEKNNEIMRLQSKLAEKIDHKDDLIAACADKDKEISRLASMHEHVSKHLEIANKSINDLHQQWHDEKNKQTKLQAQLNEKEKDHDYCIKMHEEKNAQIKRLQSDLHIANMKSMVNDPNLLQPAGDLGTNNPYEARFKEYQDNIDKRDEEIMDLKNRLQFAIEQRKVRDTQLNESQEQFKKAMAEVYSLKSQLAGTNLPKSPTEPARVSDSQDKPKRPLFFPEQPHFSDFEKQLRTDMLGIMDMLLEKNRSYGNSALDPVRIFSQASPIEQILVRIDDKLSRVQRGAEFQGEDTIRDLIGYFFLFLQAKRNTVQYNES